MTTIRAYVDTNVLKLSATELHRFAPRKENINWGGKDIEIIVHDLVDINPNLGIKNIELKAEADLLPQLAQQSAAGRIKFVMQFEARMESWGIPNMDTKGGEFYGTDIVTIDAPFKYGRTVGGGPPQIDHQLNFLKSVEHPRFEQLQRITGAYQGQRPKNRNQLIDAFHLWCAEAAGVDFFLTLDFKLQNQIKLSKHAVNIRIVRPSELLLILGS